MPDKFLASDSDVPAFGLNLACAWPFPEAWRAGYESLAAELRRLGPWLYVYPFANTHVTLVSLLSFARHVRPQPELVERLRARLPEILAALAPLWTLNSPARIKSFTLRPQMPVLGRGAAILPLLNPDGEVQRLRERTVELLRANPPLHEALTAGGMNVPGILHSTILRFRRPPPDLRSFLSAFDEIAATVRLPSMEVREFLLTSETRPYMRGGEVLRRFELAATSR